MKTTHIEEELSKNDANIVMMSGGYYDLAYSHKLLYMIYTGKWKYCIKRCLKFDYDLAFRWTFGEHENYDMVPSPWLMEKCWPLRVLKYYAVTNNLLGSVFFGRWGSLVPHRGHELRVMTCRFSLKSYTKELNKLEPESEEWNDLIKQQIETIYQQVRSEVLERMDYVQKHDSMYKGFKYVTIDNNDQLWKTYVDTWGGK